MNFQGVYFQYDPTLVCSKCRTNEKVHYNLFVRHGNSYPEFDPECERWCENCFMEPEMVKPVKTYEVNV